MGGVVWFGKEEGEDVFFERKKRGRRVGLGEGDKGRGKQFWD